MTNMKNHNQRMKKVFNDNICSVCKEYISVSDRWQPDHPFVILCADGTELLGVGVHQNCIEKGLCPACHKYLDPLSGREWEDLQYNPKTKEIIHVRCVKKKRIKTKW